MQKKRKIKITILVLLLGAVFFSAYPLYFQTKPKVCFIDVGQGDSILIQNKNTQILIDGGPSKKILNALGKLLPFYDHKLELVILTHPDKDHLFGIIEVLKRYTIEKIIFPNIQDDTAGYKEFLDLVKEKHVQIITPSGQARISFNQGYLDLLYPFSDFNGKKIKNSNDVSIVSRLVLEKESFLLTGDTEQKIEKFLVENDIYLNSDVLKVGHHGSKNATSDLFLKAINPKEAVISVGKNSYGHPHTEVLNKLKNIILKRTDQLGDIIYQ